MSVADESFNQRMDGRRLQMMMIFLQTYYRDFILGKLSNGYSMSYFN